MENDGAALVADLADQLRGMLDRIDVGALETDEETRLRIEGGVVALDAAVGILGGLQTREPATDNYFEEADGKDVHDG